MRKSFSFISLLLLVTGVYGQEQEISDIGTALRSSSAKELVKYCVDRVEIEIDGERSVYSKSQAEVVLRDFFNDNISKGFRYVHQGSSPEGPKYTIGSYQLEDGSYRVYMLLKKNGDNYQIDTISFTRE